MARVNYDDLAATYDRRYAVDPLDGVAEALEELADGIGAERILEIGCGTGRWLQSLASLPGQTIGLDASMGMLHRAQERGGSQRLVCGCAERLPLAKEYFDLLFVVNALHHFDGQRQFINWTRDLLRPGGALAIVGFDPRARPDWYIYRYFDGTYTLDVARMPSLAMLRGWLRESRFGDLEQRVVAQVDLRRRGREIFDDPFLQKESTSELTLISEEAYRAGLSRIETAIEKAEDEGEQALFTAQIDFVMTVGRYR